MKYIRTKDGIYSYEPTHNIDVDGFVVQHNLTGWDKPIMKEDVIKITDTIEELCDKWVLIDRTGFNEPYICDTYREGKELKDDTDDLIGAIFTDKGLIYVAKMNEKGELELL